VQKTVAVRIKYAMVLLAAGRRMPGLPLFTSNASPREPGANSPGRAVASKAELRLATPPGKPSLTSPAKGADLTTRHGVVP